MASEKKKKKLKNSFGCDGVLKNKGFRLKRWAFFTPSERQENKREAHWIQHYNTVSPHGYNLKGESLVKGYLSQETKDKIARANKGRIVSEETRKKLSESHKGFKVSEETKRKLSEHFRGIPPSEKAKINSAEALATSYKLKSPEGIITEGKNVKALCREYDLSPSKICLVMQGKRNHHKGWTKA